MKDILKEIKDIIISASLSIAVMILGDLFVVDNRITNYIISKILPILIMTVTVILNKPSLILKYFTFSKKSKNVKFTFELQYKDINIEDIDTYKKIVDNFIEGYKDANVRILRQKVGSEVCITSFAINSVNYDINYDDIDESLTIIINSQLNYRNFFDKVKKAVDVLNDLTGKSKVSFNRSFTKIIIEFLNDENKIKNPFFRKIYNGFNLKSANTIITTKQSTTVRLTNNCISFISNNSADKLIDDIKSVISI